MRPPHVNYGSAPSSLPLLEAVSLALHTPPGDVASTSNGPQARITPRGAVRCRTPQMRAEPGAAKLKRAPSLFALGTAAATMKRAPSVLALGTAGATLKRAPSVLAVGTAASCTSKKPEAPVVMRRQVQQGTRPSSNLPRPRPKSSIADFSSLGAPRCSQSPKTSSPANSGVFGGRLSRPSSSYRLHRVIKNPHRASSELVLPGASSPPPKPAKLDEHQELYFGQPTDVHNRIELSWNRNWAQERAASVSSGSVPVTSIPVVAISLRSPDGEQEYSLLIRDRGVPGKNPLMGVLRIDNGKPFYITTVCVGGTGDDPLSLRAAIEWDPESFANAIRSYALNTSTMTISPSKSTSTEPQLKAPEVPEPEVEAAVDDLEPEVAAVDDPEPHVTAAVDDESSLGDIKSGSTTGGEAEDEGNSGRSTVDEVSSLQSCSTTTEEYTSVVRRDLKVELPEELVRMINSHKARATGVVDVVELSKDPLYRRARKIPAFDKISDATLQELILSAPTKSAGVSDARQQLVGFAKRGWKTSATTTVTLDKGLVVLVSRAADQIAFFVGPDSLMSIKEGIPTRYSRFTGSMQPLRDPQTGAWIALRGKVGGTLAPTSNRHTYHE